MQIFLLICVAPRAGKIGTRPRERENLSVLTSFPETRRADYNRAMAVTRVPSHISTETLVKRPWHKTIARKKIWGSLISYSYALNWQWGQTDIAAAWITLATITLATLNFSATPKQLVQLRWSSSRNGAFLWKKEWEKSASPITTKSASEASPYALTRGLRRLRDVKEPVIFAKIHLKSLKG